MIVADNEIFFFRLRATAHICCIVTMKQALDLLKKKDVSIVKSAVDSGVFDPYKLLQDVSFDSMQYYSLLGLVFSKMSSPDFGFKLIDHLGLSLEEPIWRRYRYSRVGAVLLV